MNTKYDSPLRPWSEVTDIPAGSFWMAHDFTVESAYDHNYGRLKADQVPERRNGQRRL